MSGELYLDFAASTPVDHRVAAAVTAAMGACGNPSATHVFGRRSRTAIDRSRAAVAGLIGADPSEIIFTSGATESNNAAISGIFGSVAARFPGRRLRILTTPIEHPSVSEPLRALAETHGVAIDLLSVDAEGRVSAAELAGRLTDDTVLVCVMWVNNILGTVQPIEDIGAKIITARAARSEQAPPLYFFCDAVQAAAWRPIRVKGSGIDALSLSGHKMYGPAGTGALFLRRGVGFRPLVSGGGQEAGRRSGTENVTGIVGLGEAASLVVQEGAAEASRLNGLRRTFTDVLAVTGSGYKILGPAADHAAPGLVYCQSAKHAGDILALKLDEAGIAVSSGSACEAGSRKASTVIRAVYGEKAAKRGGIRISFGRTTGPDDVRRLIDVLGRL